MEPSELAQKIAPGNAPLELLFEQPGLEQFSIPEALLANYGGSLGFATQCVFANFVASLDGIVALPGDAESGQIISGRNQADRFVMGLLRACADCVLVGAGTFRKSAGHLWHPDRIYPTASAEFAAFRAALGLSVQPMLVLISASGNLDPTEPALADAWLFTTPEGESGLRGRLPQSTRVSVLDSTRPACTEVLETLRAAGLARVLTEGGPALFSELLQQELLDELFLTSSPRLFGRFAHDQRKALTDGLDLGQVVLDLLGARRHGSHLFLRYAVHRANGG